MVRAVTIQKVNVGILIPGWCGISKMKESGSVGCFPEIRDYQNYNLQMVNFKQKTVDVNSYMLNFSNPYSQKCMPHTLNRILNMTYQLKRDNF